ncbi:MAG: ATP-binding protein [Sulfuriferula sp.]
MMTAFFGSMTARIFLILVGGTIVSGALVMTLAAYERMNLETQIRMHHMAERAEQSIHMLDAIPASSRQAVVKILDHSGIRVSLSQSPTLIGNAPDAEMNNAFQAVFGARKIIVLDREDKDCTILKSASSMDSKHLQRCETVLATLSDGTPIQLDLTQRDRFPPLVRGNFLKNLILFLTGLTLIAFIVAHMATKPLRRLAKAANELGRNLEHEPLPVDKGSTEVREASEAFNSMQNSIRNHIEERTYMLAAIAHDLQTPLTRLRLRLEKVADENLRTSLVSDLTATQAMVTEGLEFARTVSVDEPLELVDLDSLVEALCNDASDAGWEVSCSGKIGKPAPAFPHALRRCVLNLLDNAVKYGTFAHVTLEAKNKKAIISIMDGGPGLPEDQLEAVFQPFKRMENSRSRSSGGTGLGLTIARIIAEKHKGTVKLRNIGAAEPGLIATIELHLP